MRRGRQAAEARSRSWKRRQAAGARVRKPRVRRNDRGKYNADACEGGLAVPSGRCKGKTRVGGARRGWGESGAVVLPYAWPVTISLRPVLQPKVRLPPPPWPVRLSLVGVAPRSQGCPNRHSAPLPNLTPPKFLPSFARPTPILLSSPLPPSSTLFTRQDNPDKMIIFKVRPLQHRQPRARLPRVPSAPPAVPSSAQPSQVAV